MTNHEGRTTTERSICRMGPATRQGNIATCQLTNSGVRTRPRNDWAFPLGE